MQNESCKVADIGRFSKSNRIDHVGIIGVARIFDWGGPKPQLTCKDVIKNFQKRKFLWGKIVVEWKI